MGMSPVQALGWRSEDTQASRFAALCRWGDLTGKSILDLGCGYGDLKTFLDSHFNHFAYIGVDFLPEFVATAKKTFSNRPDTQFFLLDFLNAEFPQVDVIMASGSLNYRCADPLHPFQVIRQMWESAKMGVAFNLLNAREHGAEKLLQAYEPNTVLDFCRQMDPDAELVMGYHPEDFTLLMRR